MFKVSEVKHSTVCLTCKGTIVPRELQVSFGKYFQHLSCIIINKATSRDMFWSSPELSPAAGRCLNAFIIGTGVYNYDMQSYKGKKGKRVIRSVKKRKKTVPDFDLGQMRRPKNKELQAQTSALSKTPDSSATPKNINSQATAVPTPSGPALSFKIRIPTHINRSNLDKFVEFQQQLLCVQQMVSHSESPSSMDERLDENIGAEYIDSHSSSPTGPAFDFPNTTKLRHADSSLVDPTSQARTNGYTGNLFPSPLSATTLLSNPLSTQETSLTDVRSRNIANQRGSNEQDAPLRFAPLMSHHPPPDTPPQRNNVSLSHSHAIMSHPAQQDVSHWAKHSIHVSGHPDASHTHQAPISLSPHQYQAYHTHYPNHQTPNQVSSGFAPSLPLMPFPRAYLNQNAIGNAPSLGEHLPGPYQMKEGVNSVPPQQMSHYGPPLPQFMTSAPSQWTPTQQASTQPPTPMWHPMGARDTPFSQNPPQSSSGMGFPRLPESLPRSNNPNGLPTRRQPQKSLLSDSKGGGISTASSSESNVVPASIPLENGMTSPHGQVKASPEKVWIQPTASCLEMLSYPSSGLSKVAVLSLLVEDDHVSGVAVPKVLANHLNSHMLPRKCLTIHLLARIFTYGTLPDLYRWSRVKRDWAAAIHHQYLWKVKCELDLTEDFRSKVLQRISPGLPENMYRTLYRWSMPPSGISMAPCVSCGQPGGQKLAELFVCLTCSKRPEYGVITKRQIGMQCGISYQEAFVLLKCTKDKKNAFLMKTIWSSGATILRDILSVQLRRARLSDHWKFHPFFDSFISERSKINIENDTKKASELAVNFKRLLIEQAKITLHHIPLFYRAWVIACQNDAREQLNQQINPPIAQPSNSANFVPPARTQHPLPPSNTHPAASQKPIIPPHLHTPPLASNAKRTGQPPGPQWAIHQWHPPQN